MECLCNSLVFLDTKLQSVNCQSNIFCPRTIYYHYKTVAASLQMVHASLKTFTRKQIPLNDVIQIFDLNTQVKSMPFPLGKYESTTTAYARCTVAIRSWSAVRVNVKHYSFTGLRMEFLLQKMAWTWDGTAHLSISCTIHSMSCNCHAAYVQLYVYISMYLIDIYRCCGHH